MKICMVNSFYPPRIGGAETYVSNLAEKLVGHSNEVTVYCANDPLPPGESVRNGVVVRRMRAPLRLYGIPFAASPPNLSAEDYDIIHCNFPSPYLCALFAFFSRARGIPSVLTWHNDLPAVTTAAGFLVDLHDFFAPTYLQQYRRIVATTEAYSATSRVLRRYAHKVSVVFSGVDTTRFNPTVNGDAIKARYGLTGRNIVLFVGALTQWHTYKGLDTLLQSFGTVKKDCENTSLLIVGGGNFADHYKRLATDLGIRDSTIFTGNVGDDLLPQCYAACDLFVMPSKNRSEGFGLALLEAMASGKPTVGSRVGGVVDVIRHEETGLLVEPNDPAGLATAMISLLRDPELRTRMGEKGREIAETNDWENVSKNMEKLYKAIL